MARSGYNVELYHKGKWWTSAKAKSKPPIQRITMNFRNPTIAIIGVSIIAAMAILAASAAFEEAAETFTYVIIAVP